MTGIEQFGIDLLDHWYPVPMEVRADDWADGLCKELEVAEEARESLSQELVRIHNSIERLDDPYLSSAVFLPRPDSGLVGCVLGFEATPIADVGGAAEFEAQLAASAAMSRPGFRVSEVETWRDETEERTQIGAGMLIEHREIGEALALVEDRRVYGVFPQGADEMVQFVFSTENFAAFTDMTAETSALVATLQVTLATRGDA